jgi:peptidylprolyl isomerase
MRFKLLPLVAVLALGTLSACGTNNSDTAHVVPAPSKAQTIQPPHLPSVTTTPAAGATGATATAKVPSTPSSGPLSTEPTTTASSAAAPKTLVTKDIVTGTGTAAAAGDELTVNYVGAVYKTGKVFDASWSHGGPKGQPIQFQLGVGAVIQGWDQGLVGMRVGGRRELIIPASLAYGAATTGSPVPPNTPLIFIVDLLGVTPASG